MLALKTKHKWDKEAQQRRNDEELNKYLKRNLNAQIAEQMDKFAVDLTAMFLWALYESTGGTWGKKRLLRVATQMKPMFKELIKHFEMEQDDAAWLCERILQENVGITREELKGLFNVESEVSVK